MLLTGYLGNSNKKKGMNLCQIAAGIAKKYFVKKSVVGDKYSQFFIGTMCQHGFGFRKNVETAMKWYNLSALKGLSMAQNCLGEIYEHEPANYEKSINFFRAAGNVGNSKAQFHLGVIHLKGLCGIPQRIDVGIHWLRVAADNGNSLACLALLIFLTFEIF